jgi:hypothetical protein
MAKKFNELRAKISPEARARSEAMTKKVLAEMEKPLSISTLCAQIEAMGGKLEVVARWPDGSFDTCDLAELSQTQ